MPELQSAGEQIRAFLEAHPPDDNQIKPQAYDVWEKRGGGFSTPREQLEDWQAGRNCWGVRAITSLRANLSR